MKIKAYYEPVSRKLIDDKLFSEFEEIKVKCICGHKTVMPVYVDKSVCSHCKRTVINNSRAYFKYKLRKELKKHEKTDNSNISGVNRVDNSN